MPTYLCWQKQSLAVVGLCTKVLRSPGCLVAAVGVVIYLTLNITWHRWYVDIFIFRNFVHILTFAGTYTHASTHHTCHTHAQTERPGFSWTCMLVLVVVVVVTSWASGDALQLACRAPWPTRRPSGPEVPTLRLLYCHICVWKFDKILMRAHVISENFDIKKVDNSAAATTKCTSIHVAHQCVCVRVWVRV